MSANVSLGWWLGLASCLVGVERRGRAALTKLVSAWLPATELQERPGRSGRVAEPPASPAERGATREWFEVLCERCGRVVDWVGGVPHSCPPRLPASSDAGSPEHATEGDVVDEICAYLASDQGRYDALVAALIIRAR